MDGLKTIEEYFGKGVITHRQEVKFWVGANIPFDTDNDIYLDENDFIRISNAAKKCAEELKKLRSKT